MNGNSENEVNVNGENEMIFRIICIILIIIVK